MGFTHSVELATELAHSIPLKNVPPGAVSLNIPKEQVLTIGGDMNEKIIELHEEK